MNGLLDVATTTTTDEAHNDETALIVLTGQPAPDEALEELKRRCRELLAKKCVKGDYAPGHWLG
jgi:hypothetical protein